MKEEKKYLTNPDYDLLGETLLTMPEYNFYKISNEEIKTRVYHCSNERLNAYFKDLNLKESRIATVGSSGDQVLNAIFYGAKDITLIDANIFTRAYFEYKTAMIKNLTYSMFMKVLGTFEMFNWKIYSMFSHDLSPHTQHFFDELMLNQDNDFHDYDEGYLTDSLIRNNLFHTPCEDHKDEEENLFYNNHHDYAKLQQLLIENNFKIEFINADITEFPTKLKGKFDYIFLSNIYEYIDKKIMVPIIKKLYKKLNAGGAIQYHYIYGYPEHRYVKSKNFNKTKEKILINENLISKLAEMKTLRTWKYKYLNDHNVYFVNKPKNENSLELNI